ncbi:efflux RND transporter permease subunit [Enterocloster lavalensis]|mgnify:FL=1|uniref:Hydrophobic/amphiphilic exporter-1, HAE1 family n=2 Tax=Enterocloster lavalensis TaxID=460384 RepID=A0A1I0IS96_9FIRM|nr:efflux RND transporter permease subunit [Enterocloster lavalensis]MBS5603486.1 efflux RND transporter permease subunit [Enterocloster asparagiformis]MCB6345730.1 efflux RND transporter permease subunit [Enterocloster lavalensis]PST31898.1 AcrB/AcrD/AcrF family protein [Enterocloster lavalensis]SEU00073.1 hydrophobic/amphiphilic exporter-1, HAE1 family [Enterocloster lavalensis]
MGLTKLVLKRPVTTVLMILCLVVFGLQAFMSSPLELMPEMNMSMIVVMTPYPGASPEDVNELVTKTVEGQVGTLSGLDTVSSMSRENVSITMLEYKYGTDMDKAYDDLKKQMDLAKVSMPDEVEDPIMLELNANLMANMILAVSKDNTDNLYNYVNDDVVPELEKLNSVAEVSINGGSKEYIRVELLPEKMNQYGVSMNSIATDIGSADLAYPAGNADMGDQQLAVSTDQKFDTLESLQDIPLTVSGKNTIYLGDVANIYLGEDDTSSIARYNGQDTIAVSVTKQQDAASLTLSSDVHDVVDELTAADPDLNITVVMDTKDNIMSSLTSVFQTMIAAIVISMVIIWMFFGDIKASLIVGSSIPVSILASFVLMNLMGFSLNVITLSALVLGVGMMVDNSTVVLESCFRATTDTGFREFSKAALNGTGVVYQSVVGSTLTTCVVFLPLAMLSGMTGEMFRPLGFTIVFCMVASLISAITVVPLCYMNYKPVEKKTAPLSRPVEKMQEQYRRTMRRLLRHKGLVMLASVALLALSIVLALNLRTELMGEDDMGQITVTVETKPGLQMEIVEGILNRAEAVVSADPNVEDYLTQTGGGGLGGSMSSNPTVTAYLRKDRDMETDDVVKLWRKELETIPNCNITVSANSTIGSMMGTSDTYQVILQSTNYDSLKADSDRIVAALDARPEVTKVHSDLENAAPVVKVRVNPIKAKAAGLSAAQIGGTLNSMLSGVSPASLEIDGRDVDIKVEYDKDRYKTLSQVQNIVLQTPTGGAVALTDVADLVFEDSPSTIRRQDKQYRVTITGTYTDKATETTEKQLQTEVVAPQLTQGVSIAMNSMQKSMQKEFTNLGKAIAMAIFLVFVVMACQFESPKFSIMVMTTVPFCLIGAFGLLWIVDSAISMTSLLGFLMLVGTVVNNGILYVDTVNQYRQTMDMETAMIEAGATRLRPILMTTLTTVLSMLPMALALGDSGETTQGLALVNIGGLTASTILALLMLPAYYSVMNRGGKQSLMAD